MSLQRSASSLPRYAAMFITPWLMVGSALILSLAIAFWAVKTMNQERENMARTLQERAGALMWAIEGGARAGMGMQRTASYLQFMMEEVGRQPDIVYLGVVTPQGDVVAHSDPSSIGKQLYPPEGMAELGASSRIQWRFLQQQNGDRIFEAYRFFTPLPGFAPMGRDSRRHGSRQRHMMGMMHGRRNTLPAEPGFSCPPGAEGVPPGREPGQRSSSPGMSGPCFVPQAQGEGLIVIAGLDMASFESALLAAKRNTLFTALLVGLLGLGGFLSLFWAQSYKLSRRMLLDARAFADEVISSLPLGLLILDTEGAVAQVNAVAEALLGCAGGVPSGTASSGLPGSFWADMERRARLGQAVLEEEYALPLVHDAGEDGETIPVSISASAIINEEGEVLGTLYLLRDLREVKRLQAELRRSERLSSLGDMAARVAHEIRNPLSSIKGFATYLGSRRDNAGGQEAARTMIGEVDRLNRVVSELLDFARPSNLTIVPASVGELLERALRLARMDAEARGVSLHLENGDPKNASALVAVDAERVTQALLNLLLNAVQATGRDGRVTLSALPPEGGMGVLRIADTGKGMSPEVLAQAFSPYFTTRATGTGLGLSIASKIVEDHQGKIQMISVPGEGTTVTVKLPLEHGTNEGSL